MTQWIQAIFLAYILCALPVRALESIELLAGPLPDQPTPGIPILVQTTLVDTSGQPLPNQTITFTWFDSDEGVWLPLEDGLTTTSVVTDSTGVADVYFVPPRSTSISVRISLPPSQDLAGAEITYNYTLAPQSGSFQTFPDLSHTKGDGIPLILVHGRSGDGPFERWSSLLDYISRNRYKFAEFDIYVWDHNTEKPVGFNGTAGSAQDLYDSLSELSASFGEFTPVFVAHSRGGLVVRSLMNRVEPDGRKYGDRVLGLVTLGTPHHGSPLAVADWSSAIWAKAISGSQIASEVFDLLVGPEGLLFQTDLIGDLNLSWDNYDGAVVQSGYHRGDPLLESDAVNLSLSDLNVERSTSGDASIYYSALWKARFGTLESINGTESESVPFGDKIVAVGTYRQQPSSFLSNLISAITIVLSLPVSTDIREWLEIQLDEGDRDHNLLSIGNRLLAHTMTDLFGEAPALNYDANDGLVPLQSALLLRQTIGNIAISSDKRAVSIDRDRIGSAKQVKAVHIFSTSDGIEDHLDLLTSDNADYWSTVTQEVRQFLPGALGFCAPDLDGSRSIEFTDFLIFADLFGGQDPRTDFNVDGITDLDDFLILASRFGQTCP